MVILIITRPINTYLKKKLGISTIENFIDDFYLLHMFETLEEANEVFKVYIEEMESFGFSISKEKLVYPSRSIRMLGFQVSSDRMIIEVDLDKLDEIRDMVEDFKDDWVRIREVASVLGKLLNMNKGLKVNVSCFLAQTAQFVIQTVMVSTQEEDWERWAAVPWWVIMELEYVLERVPQWSGRSLEMPTKAVIYSQNEFFAAKEDVIWYAGDAGAQGCVSFNMRERHKFKVIFFSLSDRSLSSSLRELMTLIHLVEDVKLVPEGARLNYITDNRALTWWTAKGSIQLDSALLLQRLSLTLWRRNIQLITAWAPRDSEPIQFADLTIR